MSAGEWLASVLVAAAVCLGFSALVTMPDREQWIEDGNCYLHVKVDKRFLWIDDTRTTEHVCKVAR